MERLLTEQQFADALGLSKECIRKKRYAGEIHAAIAKHKFVRYFESELTRFVKEAVADSKAAAQDSGIARLSLSGRYEGEGRETSRGRVSLSSPSLHRRTKCSS